LLFPSAGRLAGEPEEADMEDPVEDFDIPQNKLAESAERVVDRALDEARRREHALLTNEHVCLAFAQVEWDMFGQVMRDVELNPHEILQALEEHLRLLPSVAGRDLLGPSHDRSDRSVLGDF
jgi:ATP-dependent Clp protease ATP-binding subunit ClpA